MTNRVAGVGPTSQRVPFRWALAKSIPAIALAVAALVAGGLGFPGLAAVAALLAAAASPIAHTLSTRVILWLVGALALSGVLSLVPGWPPHGLVSALALGAGLGSVVILAHRSPNLNWRPAFDGPDLAVAAAGAALTLLLLAPIWGAGSETVVLDLGRGFDHLGHFTMVKNIVGEQGTEWQTADGSAAMFDHYFPAYPLGFHVLLALALGVGGESGPDSMWVVPYAEMTAIAAGISAAVIGWTTLSVAGSSGSGRERPARRRIAAGIFAPAAALGGTFSGLFEIGHVAFLLPTAAVIAASWLATSHVGEGAPLRRSMLMGMAVLGAFGAYPPLVFGLLPAGVFVARTALPGIERARKWSVAAGLIVGVLGLMIIIRWSPHLHRVAAATGPVSTPPGTLLAGLCWLLLCLLAAARFGWLGSLRRATLATQGFAACAVALAILTLSDGYGLASAYYPAKLGQAAWVSTWPAVIAGTAAVLQHAGNGWPSSRSRPMVIVAASAVALLMLAAPDGRYAFKGVKPPAVVMAMQRVTDAERLPPTGVVTAAGAVGPSTGDGTLTPDMAGWAGPLAVDSNGLWLRTPSAGSLWAASLRGVLSEAQYALTDCVRVDASEGLSRRRCLGQWLDAHPSSGITLVVVAHKTAEEYQWLQEEQPGRVRIVVLPAPAP